jgi:hypothetical protein
VSVIAAGQRWWTTTDACMQLQVRPENLRDWVRRSRTAGHVPAPAFCPVCNSGQDAFPHVDPPVRRGRLAGYVADQLLDVELYTATSTRGNRRSA